MNNFDNILKLGREGKIEELRNLAISQGLKPHHRAKPMTLAQAIIDHVSAAPPQPQNMKHPAERAQPAPLKIHTPDEVRKDCAEYLDKDGFEAIFREDNTWHFKYKGAEDSGHMSTIMRVIKLKAMTVAQGARKLRTMGAQFDDLPGDARGTFANTVIAG